MPNGENLFLKLAKSSKENATKPYILNNDEIINYFNMMVNDNKFIHTKRYDLEIICDDEADCQNIIIFDSKSNKFIFNKGILFSKWDDKNLSKNSYDFNLLALETINSIIAKIELLRMLDDQITYKKEPIFYTYLVKELLNSNNNGILLQHYIKMRKLQLTSFVLNYSHNNYGLSLIKKLDYDLKCNQKIINTFNVKYDETPIYDAINYETDFKMDDYGYFLENLTPVIIERFGTNVASAYNEALKNNTKESSDNNLLNCILLGKPIENIDDIIKISKYRSIFEYAETLNEIEKNKIIRKIRN
jgi:hypothetical protein